MATPRASSGVIHPSWQKRLNKANEQLKRVGRGTAIASKTEDPDLPHGWYKPITVAPKPLSRRERRAVSFGPHVKAGSKKCLRCGKFPCSKMEIREPVGKGSGILFHKSRDVKCFSWRGSREE